MSDSRVHVFHKNETERASVKSGLLQELQAPAGPNAFMDSIQRHFRTFGPMPFAVSREREAYIAAKQYVSRWRSNLAVVDFHFSSSLQS